MMKKLSMILLVLCLSALSLSALAEPINVMGLESDTEATVLDFDAAGIDVTDARALAACLDQMPGLQEVLMFDSSMDQDDMGWLFDTYPDIFFGFTLRLATHIIRTDATAFSTLHFSSPKKDDPRHSSEELYILRMCKKLRALDIGHNNLTDLNFLYFLPDLEVLIISPNYGLTDITPVANCTKLVYLECFNTPVEDISALAGLTELRDLNLTRCGKVKDISPLFDLPNLQRFWWGHMDKVSVDQKKTMRANHPGCKFVMVYDPTDGGWRRHKHYDELHEFFRTGIYVPFSDIK